MTTEHAETQASADGEKRKGRGGLLFLRDVAVIIVIAIVASFLLKTFIVRSFYIPSASMEDTLQIDDRILVDEITPRFTGYHRGDVIVFSDPGGWLPAQPAEAEKPWLARTVDTVLTFVGLSTADSDDHLVKRIIGLPGDHVKCCNALGQITVNGTPLDESAYVKLQPGETTPQPVPFDVVVPKDSLWVLGDNRDESRDSRYNQNDPGKGYVPMTDVVGRAFLITWPFNRFGLISSHPTVFAGVPEPSGSTPTTTTTPSP
ncbi:signal peptidase I [Microbacterium mangrovi]|uniref:Signal peptidase I n=1 Tax=Microbacterium mangrovi TaxID=1348253 RepID=A0A0B2A6U8_9MICO|nr:signal peptidase I [Microbacterium mangrovi]KHK97503.1 signal peptidase I [Microbacterium mangrovi]